MLKVPLLDIGLSLLTRVLSFQLARICLEEVHGLLWVLPRDIVESTSGNIVRLALPHQGIIFQQVLDLRSVRVCLGMQDSLRLSPGISSAFGGCLRKYHLRRDILKLHFCS